MGTPPDNGPSKTPVIKRSQGTLAGQVASNGMLTSFVDNCQFPPNDSLLHKTLSNTSVGGSPVQVRVTKYTPDPGAVSSAGSIAAPVPPITISRSTASASADSAVTCIVLALVFSIVKRISEPGSPAK